MKQNVNLKCAKLGKRAGGSYGIVFKRYFNCPYYYSKFFISCKIILVFLLKKIKQYILNKIKKKKLESYIHVCTQLQIPVRSSILLLCGFMIVTAMSYENLNPQVQNKIIIHTIYNTNAKHFIF